MTVGWILLGGLALLSVIAVEAWEWRRERRWQRMALDFEKQAELRALKRAAEEQRKKDAA